MMRQLDASGICVWHMRAAYADLLVGSKMHGEYGENSRRFFYPLSRNLAFRNACGGSKK